MVCPDINKYLLAVGAGQNGICFTLRFNCCFHIFLDSTKWSSSSMLLMSIGRFAARRLTCGNLNVSEWQET